MTEPLTLKAGQIRFAEACLPPLESGGYRVRMTQVLAESVDASKPSFTRELEFEVQAPQFSLAPADIHSVFPPIGQSGQFASALPHVVLTRRTLPWERTIEEKRTTPPRPWMCVLLLDEGELREAASSTGSSDVGRVRSLPILAEDSESLLFAKKRDVALGCIVPDEDTLVPDLRQATDERVKKALGDRYGKQRCLALDLPAQLFKQLVPLWEDLPFLAHVREVDTGGKEVLAINDKGWFSVVVGNRLPKPDRGQRAFLVSLEGHKARLEETFAPGPEQRVRLAVLGSWSFTCEGDRDFKGQLKALSTAPLALPFQPVAAAADAARIVREAYVRGYTACNHGLRHGEQTVSWYRGPLIPLEHEKPAKVQAPVRCADELLRYDPTTGMFDASYACAWQLGRLLSLQNHSFASALDRMRRLLRAEAEQKLRAAELGKRYPALGGELEQGWLRLLQGQGAAKPTGDLTLSDALSAVLIEAEGRPRADEVSSWLGRLVLLYGVPFHYLIAEPKMLPERALRFFYLDPNWIQSLVQGACSIGSNGRGDNAVDKAMNEWLQPSQPEGASTRGEAGHKAASVRDRLREQYEAIPRPQESARLDWPLTGFLLRSPVVAGWRGLEISAYRGKEELTPLRLEQLSSDVMLGIFNGALDTLVIREPQEALHFGLSSPTTFARALRDLRTGAGMRDQHVPPGRILRTPESRVLRVAKLASDLETELVKIGQQLAKPKLTSAEFAVQMIEAASELTFTRDAVSA
jgi:hypothetical protein